MSSPTTIAYLPTALGASKATLLLNNNPSSGPYAWQLPQCTITSNPYGGATGTYGLLNCIAIQNGAISAVVWFYLPPGGQGGLLGITTNQYPNPATTVPLLYVLNGYLSGSAPSVPISPGWHIAVFESWASSTSGPFYFSIYLDGQFKGTTSTSASALYSYSSTFPYSDIGTIYYSFSGQWLFFNGAVALVALYNRVLTTGDVLTIYQGNLVSSGLVAVWYGDDYNPSNGYWISRVGNYTGAPITSSYPPRGCILWNSTWYSGPTGIWSNWQQC